MTNCPNPTLRAPRAVAVAAILTLLPLAPASAKEAGGKKTLGWTDKAELSYVVTGGNAETSTLGFKNTLKRVWELALLDIRAGAVRAESTKVTRRAVGTRTDFAVDEDQVTETTAEAYFLKGKYDHEISKRLFWHAGGGWERNRFSGVENRFSVAAGVGNVWRDDDTVKFRTDYSATFTRQDDVVAVRNDFLGVQFSWDYTHAFGASTTYENALDVNENIEDTNDLRAAMTNGVSVAINDHVAIKLTHALLYDNRPALVSVALFQPDGTRAGEQVLVELDELDTIFTSSVVLNF